MIQPSKVPTAPVSSIVHEPAWYRGKSVRVGGEIEAIHDPRAFTLEGDELWSEHDITVVTRTPVEFFGLPLDDDDDVIVTGRIVVGVAEAERAVGRSLEPEVARAIGDRAVLVARTVRLVDEVGTWSAEDPQPASLGLNALLTFPDPEKLVGQRVVIGAAEIRSVGRGAIWIGSRRSKQLIVVPADAAMLDELRPGLTVSITGIAKQLPAAAEAHRRFGLDASAKDALDGATLYVEASRIEPASQPTAMSR